MGCVENITHERFPKQGKNLGHLLRVTAGSTDFFGSMVRDDREKPFRTIYRTTEGQYILSDELQGYKPAPQGSHFNKRTDVCFNFNTEHVVTGKIVRDDATEPYRTIIELEDGRVVLATECQYSPKYDDEPEMKRKISEDTKEVKSLKKRLKRSNVSEREKILIGIYKQLVSSRKNKTANGEYNSAFFEYGSGHTHLLQSDLVQSPEILVNQIVRQVNASRFVDYVVDEMRKHDRLRNHANRLEQTYSGSLQVDLTKGLSKPARIVKIK